MHIPDGYLGPVTYGGLWAAMVPLWMLASRKMKDTMKASQVPFLATASAFSLMVMIFTVPLPGGTSGHMSGTALISVLLGPWAAILAVSVALIIQALVFGDGGITSLGANCFNIAFIGSMSAFFISRLVTSLGSLGGSVRETGKPVSSEPPLTLRLVGAGLAAYVSVNLGALFTALELGVQPLLHKSAGAALYFPYSLDVALPAVMLPHLTAVGFLEATVTVLVLLALSKFQHNVARGWKPAVILFFAFFFSFTSAVSAHDYWIERHGREYSVVFGHGKHREDVDPAKIKTIRAFDSQGKAVAVSREKKEKAVVLKPAEQPSIMAVEIDNGYWSKTIYGWKNLPKRQASRVVEANRSFNYSKTILSWSEAAQRSLDGFMIDMTPLKNPFQMKAGEKLPVRVLFMGKPLVKAEVIGGDHEKVAETDKDGIAQVPLTKGDQLFTISHKDPLKGDPDADYRSITSTLSFEVPK